MTESKYFSAMNPGERTLDARTAIAADGINSIIVDSLGLNKKRQVINPNYALPMYVMEDIYPDVVGHETGWVHVQIPNLAETGFRIGTWKGDTKWVHGDWQNLEKYPRYASWFSRAKVVKKYAFSQIMRTSLREPVCGNVIVVGDAGATTETWIQGAMASGYKAVKAIIGELNGQNGYAEYKAWWLKAFYFNDPGYIKRIIALHTINRICNDEETDYLFQLVKDKGQMPHFAVVRNLDLVKADRLELYERIHGFMGKMHKRLEAVLAAYPPDSTIFKEPDAYLDRWRT